MRALLVAGVGVVALALSGGSAVAGSYTVVQCDGSAAGVSPAAEDAIANQNWVAYVVKDQCQQSDQALKVNNVQSARDGAIGAWHYSAPDGTIFAGIEVGVRLVKAAGHRPSLYVSRSNGTSLDEIAVDTADEGWRHKEWTAEPSENKTDVGVRLWCNPPSGDECAESSSARAWMRNLALTLSDRSAPTSQLDGSLLSPGWHAGTKSLAVSAQDVGAGVRRIEVEANGATAAERTFECATIPGTSSVSRLQPCATSQVASFDLDTSQAPFHEGSNSVEVCVEDFGVASVNRTCTTRTVKVDNVGPGAPQNLTVAGGEGWRYTNDFDLSWTNPDQPEGAEVDGAYVEVVDAEDAVVAGPTLWSGLNRDHLENLSVPGNGQYRALVWLRDAAGNATSEEAAKAELRLDDAAPAPVEVQLPNGWLSRRELFPSYAQRWAAPAPPTSGFAGYAISVDRFPNTNPCETAADPDPAVCVGPEVNRPASAESEPLSDLAEGTTYVHAAAVSGSGLRSSSVAHVELEVDLTDPEVELLGGSSDWINHPVTLVAHATDSLSGMQPIQGDDGQPRTAIQVDGGEVQSDPDNEVTLTLDSEGDHTVRYWARDLAGNENDGADGNGEPGVERTRIDMTPPDLSFKSQDSSDPELVRVDVDDSLSGANSGQVMYRRQGDSTWQPLATEANGDELRARFPSEQLPDGLYELRADATDEAGNAATSTQRADGTHMELEVPLKTETRLHVRFGTGGDRRHVGYGRPAGVSGRLLDGAGRPVRGEPVQVTETYDDGSSLDPRERTLITDAKGQFSAALPPGTSRSIDVDYSGSRQFTSADPDRLRLEVAGGASLQSSSERVHVGKRFHFKGRVKHFAARVPDGGKLVELQVHRPEGWDTVRQAFRTRENGHWRFPFRFGDYYVQPTRFRFRLKVVRESGWPYKQMETRSRGITVIPR